MRKTVAQGVYLLITELIAVYLVVFPVYAFQVSSSSTGYVRVATQSAQLAYVAANRVSMISTVASAAVAASPVSVAVRMVTGPVGWAVLGVSVALTLAQMYYSSSDISAVKTAASPVNTSVLTWTFQGTTYNVSGLSDPQAYASCPTGFMWFDNLNQTSFSPRVPGMSATPFGGFFCIPSGSTFATTAPTQAQVESYLQSLAPGAASSVETHTSPLGQGVSPTPGDHVSTVPVTPTELTPTVKSATQVLPTDAVIDPNAPPPSGPQPVTTPSTTTTTTTTTTTNPDGSTTAQSQDAPTILSCSAGNHDQRSFGSVLQEHITRWQGTGLLSALNLLKTLTWPTAIPTYAISTTILGNFTLDFSSWSGMLIALRSLIIALASFVAFRIIFVGNT